MVTKEKVLKKDVATRRAKNVLITYVQSPAASVSGLARTIEIDRSNLHAVMRNEGQFLSGSQTIMFMAELYRKGILDDAMNQIIGEGEECIFNESFTASSLRQSLAASLTRRFQKRKR